MITAILVLYQQKVKTAVCTPKLVQLWRIFVAVVMTRRVMNLQQNLNSRKIYGGNRSS